jgi:hypothetical protein
MIQNQIKHILILFALSCFCIISILPLTGQMTKYNGLTIENPGSHLAYIAYQNKPLLAFGCHFEHMLFDDYDYKHWTEWMISRGMNHCRTRLYHAYYTDYSPFHRTPDGKFNLTEWDEGFWNRCHDILSYLQNKGIIVHLLIFPQGTGGNWWQGDGYYSPENNIHPETANIRPKKSTAGFWQSFSQGNNSLYNIQTAIIWKLIEETAEFDNIIYDICHEPFIHAMSPEEQEDMKEFLDETTKQFIQKYQEIRPGVMPLMGLDTDFTPPGNARDWIFSNEHFSVMIQGKNHDPFYVTAKESIELVKTYRKPYCAQESLDLPGIIHVEDVKHKNSLSYYEPGLRNHLRKYVWRWIMARSQLIDIYQKSASKDVPDRERYEPEGHNEFENDALIIREFWDQIMDYPNLDFRGIVEEGPGEIQMVLSSRKEAIIYLSSKPGEEGIQYLAQDLNLSDLCLLNGNYTVEFWKPSAPGGIVERKEIKSFEGAFKIQVPDFVDDIVLHIF